MPRATGAEPNPTRNSGFRRKGLVAAVIGAVSLGMLGLSFAAVPLYRLFCAATGYGGTTQVAKAAPTLKGMRDLTVRFDANVAPGLTWKFTPETPEIKLRTGETATVFYKVTNMSGADTAAQAMYNVSPESAGAYFDKISCFCFNEQKLGPHESADMPVVFFLDPALEKDETMAEVQSITLSYTFFASKSSISNVEGGAVAKAETPSSRRDDRSP
jgi:cytochrome c oxidase assembly protein subunit 11